MRMGSGRRITRRLGSFVLAAYLAAGPGAGALALAAGLLQARGASGASACGCHGGHECCGAPCCAHEMPAPRATSASPADPGLPDCCLPTGATAGASTCRAGAGTDIPAPPAAAVALALAARCTCGDHGGHLAGVPAFDTHLPASVSAGLRPPLPSRLDPGPSALSTGNGREPTDPVPKPHRQRIP